MTEINGIHHLYMVVSDNPPNVSITNKWIMYIYSDNFSPMKTRGLQLVLFVELTQNVKIAHEEIIVPIYTSIEVLVTAYSAIDNTYPIIKITMQGNKRVTDNRLYHISCFAFLIPYPMRMKGRPYISALRNMLTA